MSKLLLLEEPNRLDRPHIGIFDSGVGGLTILDALLGTDIVADFSYLADTQHMPYGEKPSAFVLKASQNCLLWLKNTRKVDYIIAACNTAAASLLNANAVFRNSPVIDPITVVCERLNQEKQYTHLGMLATQGTVLSGVHRQRLDTDIKLTAIPCLNLAQLIEQGEYQSEECYGLVKKYLAPLLAESVDAVILGCTHYPLLASYIRQLIPDIPIIDPATFIADHLQEQLQYTIKTPCEAQSKHSSICYYTTSAQEEQFYTVCQKLPFKHLQVSRPNSIELFFETEKCQ